MAHLDPAAPTGALRIRRGTDRDMPFFEAMEFETTWHNLASEERETLDPAQVREALGATHALLLDRPANAFFVAESAAGERVGLLWFGENRNLLTGETEAWIYNVSVVASHRGQGIGAQLVAHALAYARERGYRTLGLMVATHNVAARRLYSRLGFEESNVLMRRRLDGPDGA
jgi:ribosomal protein S18 acetylase RimI-like enzyme